MNNFFYKIFQKPPPVGVLPLGTGNDLSQVLGWGNSHSGSVNAVDYLQQLTSAKLASIDRWKIHFKPARNLGK